MNRQMSFVGAAVLMVFLGYGATALAGELSFTDFESFSLGSVNGQGGWMVLNANYDQAVVQDGSNKVWRVSNAFTSGVFGDQPFAPCPGGVPTDGDGDLGIEGINGDNPTEAVNNNGDSFAGESSTGATFARFYAEFNFKSATGAAQPGLRVTVSADDCEGARQSFIAIEDTGKGIDIVTADNNPAGSFTGGITIAKALSYTEWHTFAVEIIFNDGEANDIARYFVNGELVRTKGSWEQFYRQFQAVLHPDGVPVQTLLFRLSGDAAPGTLGGGYFVDNVLTSVSYSLRPPLDPGRR